MNPSPPAPATPTLTHHLLSDKTLIWLDILAGLVGAMISHDLGRQVWKWVQGVKHSAHKPSQTGAASTTQPASTGGAQQGEAPQIDLTLHSSFMGIGPMDEAAFGQTTGAVFKRLLDQLAQASEAQVTIEQAKLDSFDQVFIQLAKLTDHQCAYLREVVGKMPTAQEQAEFWSTLAHLSKDENRLKAYLKVMGIVHEPPEFWHQLGSALATGLEQANTLHQQIVDREGAALQHRLNAALNLVAPPVVPHIP